MATLTVPPPGPGVPVPPLPPEVILLSLTERIAVELVYEIGLAVFVDPINMAIFTQGACETIQREYPDKNVMIVHSGFNFSLFGPVHCHYELPLQPIGGFARTQGYEVYTFDSGTFNLTGDGGFQNWCFSGSYTLDPNNHKSVTFYKPRMPHYICLLTHKRYIPKLTALRLCYSATPIPTSSTTPTGVY